MFLVVTSLYIICDLQIRLNVDILIVGDIKWIEHSSTTRNTNCVGNNIKTWSIQALYELIIAKGWNIANIF